MGQFPRDSGEDEKWSKLSSGTWPPWGQAGVWIRGPHSWQPQGQCWSSEADYDCHEAERFAVTLHWEAHRGSRWPVFIGKDFPERWPFLPRGMGDSTPYLKVETVYLQTNSAPGDQSQNMHVLTNHDLSGFGSFNIWEEWSEDPFMGMGYIIKSNASINKCLNQYPASPCQAQSRCRMMQLQAWSKPWGSTWRHAVLGWGCTLIH